MMHFPVSGVDVSPIVPVGVGFLIALCTTPTGVSGAFLLLPFQFSVLDFTSPGVTPTNLLYNVFSTPGSILGYRRLGAIDWALIRAIFLGAGPGVVVGAFLRVSLLADPATFRRFAGMVLLVLGVILISQSLRTNSGWRHRIAGVKGRWITLLGAGAGMVGGIYGISGGSIIAPVLVGIFALPVKRVAPAALIATLMTSVTGVISFELLGSIAPDVAARQPDWALGLLFGTGGAAGGFVGAHINARMPERALRALLGLLALVLAITYLWPTGK